MSQRNNDKKRSLSPLPHNGSIRYLAVCAVLSLFAAGTSTGCSDSMNDSESNNQQVDDKNEDFVTDGKGDSLTNDNIRERILYIGNTYTLEELEAFLPRLSALGIVERRESEGEFDSLRDLDKAKYVGRYAFEQIRKEARSLSDDLFEDTDDSSEAAASIDRSGQYPTLILEGASADQLVELFDEAYVNGTEYSPIDCQTAGTTRCEIPAGQIDEEADSEEYDYTISSRDSGSLDSTFDIYDAAESVGTFDGRRLRHTYGPFACADTGNGVYGSEDPHYFCEVSVESSATSRSTITLQGGDDALPELGSSRIWEGWLIVDGDPVSTGHFRAESGTSSYEFAVDAETAEQASKFVLTIEPADEDEGTPSAQKYLAGPLEGGSATISTTAGPTLGGADLSEASGEFFLAAPSGRDNPETDYRNGIWFIDNSGSSMAAGLDLPELGEGWTYEGWVVGEDGPVSTGRFDNPSEADSDRGGPFAGAAGTPPFPGQDFVLSDGRRDLTAGYKAVITVEPKPDNSPKPFAVKPLANSIEDAGKGTLQQLGTNPLPTATVNVE
jgi:hypothetical protein